MSTVQLLRGTSVTVTETFTVDGAPSDLDAGVPTVVALYPDGTALSPAPVASGAWTGRTTGQYRIVLDAQALVTYLDPITWVGTIGGKVQTLRSRVEWIGGLLFNLADLRALKVANGTPFASTTDYPATRLQDVRTATLEEFTRILGISPVPRFARELHSGDGWPVLFVANHTATSLRSVTVDGTAQTLADFDLEETGQLTWETGAFPATRRRNVAVEYEHGWSSVAGDGSNVAMVKASAALLPSGFSSAQTVVTPDGASYTYEPSETGHAGFQRHTGIRDVDRWLNRWSARVPGFA